VAHGDLLLLARGLSILAILDQAPLALYLLELDLSELTQVDQALHLSLVISRADGEELVTAEEDCGNAIRDGIRDILVGTTAPLLAWAVSGSGRSRGSWSVGNFDDDIDLGLHGQDAVRRGRTGPKSLTFNTKANVRGETPI